MKTQSWILTLAIVAICTACGAQDDQARQVANPGGSVSTELGNPDSRVSTGSVRFMVDGRSKSFDFISSDHTSYSTLASKIQAQPAPGSKESITTTFLNVDLKKLDYPIELPLPRDEVDPRQAMMALIQVGFGYTDENGSEWAGSGRVHLDSLQPDGTLAGSFGSVSLPHTEKELPNIVLNHGDLSVRLWSQ